MRRGKISCIFIPVLAVVFLFIILAVFVERTVRVEPTPQPVNPTLAGLYLPVTMNGGSDPLPATPTGLNLQAEQPPVDPPATLTPVVVVVPAEVSPVEPSATPEPAAANDTADPFTFVSWADTKTGLRTLARLSNQAWSLEPAFSIFSGDLEEDGFTETGASAWANALNGNGNHALVNITFAVRGNHDKDNTEDWQSYFNASATGAFIGVSNFETFEANLAYGFDYGNAYFIILDVPGDISKLNDEQLAYLDRGLSGAESRGLTHAFVFFHAPLYAVSKYAPCDESTCPTPAYVAKLINVLNQHPIVSAVFGGHEHLQAYIHLDQTRIPEITHPFEAFITGSAGAGLYDCDKPARFDMCGSYHGFAAITVSGRSFTVNVYQLGVVGPVKTYTFTKP